VIDPKPMWDFDNPKVSQEKFEMLAQSADNEFDKAILVTQVARALGLQGQYEQGLEILESIISNSPEVQAFIHIETGRILRSSGKPDKARPEFEIAAELTKANNMEELHIDALHMIALVLPQEEQISFTLKAIEIAKASSDAAARNWVASLLNNLGMAHSDLGNWSEALKCFEEALAEREAMGDQSRIFIARYMIGWALRNLSRNQEALNHMVKLQEDLTLDGKSDEYVAKEIELLKVQLES